MHTDTLLLGLFSSRYNHYLIITTFLSQYFPLWYIRAQGAIEKASLKQQYCQNGFQLTFNGQDFLRRFVAGQKIVLVLNFCFEHSSFFSWYHLLCGLTRTYTNMFASTLLSLDLTFNFKTVYVSYQKTFAFLNNFVKKTRTQNRTRVCTGNPQNFCCSEHFRLTGLQGRLI